MGFLDSILGEDKGNVAAVGKPSTANPFNVTFGFSQLRLASSRRNSLNLLVRVKNISHQAHLVSVDAHLPKEAMLGFDNSSINKYVEKRAGELKPGQSIEVPIEVWANNQTKSGNYPMEVTVYSHYIGYDKVLSYIKKSTSLRVV